LGKIGREEPAALSGRKKIPSREVEGIADHLLLVLSDVRTAGRAEIEESGNVWSELGRCQITGALMTVPLGFNYKRVLSSILHDASILPRISRRTAIRVIEPKLVGRGFNPDTSNLPSLGT
jgi:hypothetical protein